MMPPQDLTQLISGERKAATQRALESVFDKLTNEAIAISTTEDWFYSHFQTTITCESQVALPSPPGIVSKVNFYQKVELTITSAGVVNEGYRATTKLAEFVADEYASIVNLDNLRSSVCELDPEFLRNSVAVDVPGSHPLGIADGTLKISLVKYDQKEFEHFFAFVKDYLDRT